MPPPQRLLICRTDAVGDVILTFPICGVVKQFYPGCRISLLGRSYTRDAASICEHIDEFLNYDELDGKDADYLHKFFRNIDVAIVLMSDLQLGRQLKTAGIRKRIGTSHSLHHWRTCNHLVFYRKTSRDHEVKINLNFLKGIGIRCKILRENFAGFMGATKISPLKSHHAQLLSPDKFNLILHPKSHGNAKEWDLGNFAQLIARLDQDRVRIFITGSKKEKEILADWLKDHARQVTDVTGRFDLAQFISFISHADGLIAGSTGPLHIAAATGIHALGLFPDIPSKNGGRWGPVGRKAEYLECVNQDMNTITTEMVLGRILTWLR